MAKNTSKHYCGIGGQAVLEGVMMKNKDTFAVAVRKPDGVIEVKTDEYKSYTEGKKLLQLPFIRGVFNFIDSLVLGTRALNFSASFYEDETADETVADKVINKTTDNHAEAIWSAITMVLSFVVAIGLFMVLPYFLASFLEKYVRNESLMALFEALIRVLIFLIYVVGISLMKDIRRVYMYHGAEHKCINCIERGRELNVENVRKSSRLHKRCGTSFILFVVFVSAIVFFFIRVDQTLLKVVLRIVLIPVIAGISYELIRLAGRSDNFIVRIISAPGLMLQKLTTKEPDDDMIEVAIASVNAVFDWKAYFKETFNYDVDEKNAIYETIANAGKVYAAEETDESEEKIAKNAEHSAESITEELSGENIAESAEEGSDEV